ncbi:enterobactin exporter EntS [Komagataeibacter europaeus]|uniref:Enterobactin exporter EntS n=1 Tax=Komagataeibacter europaeus TaxID=33995 RepID=A0A0M0ECG2_KOMEU|nr:enterobactin exporter EntS [Komagataeibacter europaeus]
MSSAPVSPSPPRAEPSLPAVPLHRHPGLPAFLAARTASSFSACVQAVAVGWQIYALTHSTTALALVGLAQFLPMAGLLLPAGHAADHLDRRMIVVTCQCIEALSALLMAIGALGGWTTPWMIYAMVMVFGAARAFEMPCQQTFLPSLVPVHVFPRAAAVSSSLFQAAAVTGPSVGGLLYGAGAGVCYLVCAVGFACACVGTLCIRLAYTPRPRVPLSLATFVEVMHFMRARPDMLGAISLDLFAVLLGGATAMLPVFASDILPMPGRWGWGCCGPRRRSGLWCVPSCWCGDRSTAGRGRACSWPWRSLAWRRWSLPCRVPWRCPSSRWRCWGRRMWSAWWCVARWCSCARPTACADGFRR